MQEQDPLGDLPAAFFLHNVLSFAPAEMNNTPGIIKITFYLVFVYISMDVTRDTRISPIYIL